MLDMHRVGNETISMLKLKPRRESHVKGRMRRRKTEFWSKIKSKESEQGRATEGSLGQHGDAEKSGSGGNGK